MELVKLQRQIYQLKFVKFYDRIIAGSLFIVGNKNINKSKFRSKYGIYVISLLDGVM